VFAPAVQLSQAERERQEAERLERERQERLRQGGSDSHYRLELNLALDGFSGYAVFRSPEFGELLRQQGIKLQLTDDGADYPARLAALKRGDVDMAVFTIDALIKTCAEAGDLPATIVALVDETVGADAIVAYKETIPNVDALNDPKTKFVLTPNSPSETLARVVMSRFQLDALDPQPFIAVKDASAVVARYKDARPVDRLAFVLWEPYVTQVLKNERMHVVVDSSRFPSAIVDVLVASDDFIAKHRDEVKTVVECYQRANYIFREDSTRIDLVIRDAAESGTSLSREEATRLVKGVWWKNTQENLAHMGQIPGTRLPHIEDMIAGITAVLRETGAIESDPTGGRPNYLYNDSVWQELTDFHPGAEKESIRGTQLPKLTEVQWQSLAPAGTARAPTLVFARGTDRLTDHSKSLLDNLAGTLESTRFYVVVRGNASRQGDLEANKRLALQRAKAVEAYLVAQGVDSARIRAIGVEPSGSTSVSFVLGQPPY
jgi:flagellar motor protein MotB